MGNRYTILACGIPRFNALNWIQFLTFIPIYLRSILIFSSHLRLDFPIGFFPAKMLKPISSVLTTCPAYLSFLDLIILTTWREWYIICSSSLWNLIHSLFYLLSPNISLRKWPLYIFSYISSLMHVPQSYNTTGNIRNYPWQGASTRVVDGGVYMNMRICLINSHGQPTRSGPPAWRFGVSHCKNHLCSETSHKASELDWWFGTTMAKKNGHVI